MAFVKRNNYLPEQDLTNLAQNVDLNRVSDDKTFISVSFSGSPATVTIKAGSLIEVNGNQYDITSDEVFVMDNGTDSYIIFDGVTFSTAPTVGTERADKGGWYQADDISRTLNWDIDQANNIYGRLAFRNQVYKSNIYAQGNIDADGKIDAQGYIEAQGNTKISVKIASSTTTTGLVPLSTERLDTLNEWNNSTYRFTPSQDGIYYMSLNLQGQFTSPDTAGTGFLVGRIKKNGTTYLAAVWQDHYSSGVQNERIGVVCDTVESLTVGDYIEFEWNGGHPGAGNMALEFNTTNFSNASIFRVV
jgi:hypothetical protein